MANNSDKEKRIKQHVNSVQELFEEKNKPKEQEQKQTHEDNKSRRRPSSS